MALPESTAFFDIVSLGKLLRSGKTSALELTKFFLARCEKQGPGLNAIVSLARKQAIADAGKADAELKAGKDRGPLHGIPFGVKDLLATKGLKTTWGAAPYQEQIIDEDAFVVTKLKSAGAVLIAKLAMVELAGGFGYRQANASFTGPGKNPWGKDRWSGGSSSGSGSAVGGGLVPFAIGSETWGSILTPSGYCGIAGLRPTYGLVSRRGAMALSWTMDKLGPMCRTARDCGLVLAAMAGKDAQDPSSTDHGFSYPGKNPLKGKFRIARLRNDTRRVQKPVKQNFGKTLDVVSEFAKVETIDLPSYPFSTIAGTVISCEMASAFDTLIRSGDVWELTAEEDRYGGHSPMLIPAVDYLRAQRLRSQAQRAVDKLFQDFDAIIAPTLSTVAPPIAKPFGAYMRGFSSTGLSGCVNVCGLPGISIPNGFGERNLPTGVTLACRAFDEDKLLGIAELIQSKTDWHKKTPK